MIQKKLGNLYLYINSCREWGYLSSTAVQLDSSLSGQRSGKVPRKAMLPTT